ncbi:hypothetical protein [Streptomyces sparsus]
MVDPDGEILAGREDCRSDASVGRILHASFPEVDSLDPVSYISEIGDAVLALLYSRLYWPKLVEFHGAVFVALWGEDGEYISSRLQGPAVSQDWSSMSWERAVDSFNSFEIHQIFRQIRGPDQFSEAAHAELGSVLTQTWQARLGAAYPERRFRVQFVGADEVVGSRIEVRQEYPMLRTPDEWSAESRTIEVPSQSTEPA